MLSGEIALKNNHYYYYYYSIIIYYYYYYYSGTFFHLCCPGEELDGPVLTGACIIRDAISVKLQ